MGRLDDQPITLDLAPRARRGWWTPAMTIQAIILAAIVSFHYQHTIKYLVHVWQNNGDWSHGFIIPLFSLYYLYLRRDRMPLDLPHGGLLPRLAGALLLVAGFALYARSTLRLQTYPQEVSLVITIMGIVLMVCGWPIARWSWFAVGFLLFAMPLPGRLYQQLTMPLRELATVVSAQVLAVVPDLITEAQGTVVEYSYAGRLGTLDVEHACSGMRLMVTMTALGVAMAFVNERPLWHRMIMILACIPIAIFCNIIRVTTTGFLIVFGREELARGFWHMMLGLGMLFIAFGLYGGISYVLSHLFEEGEPQPRGVAIEGGVGG